jgi:predicted enzyme related to lactoylglutathione lyase
MIKVAEVAFTAYPVTDMARARAFYENVLGLQPATINGPTPEMQWVEYEIGPHTLALSNMAPDWKPNPDGGCAALEVEDFDHTISELRAAGVAFRVEPFPTPVCNMAVITDPDGNSLVIHRRHDH